MTPPRPFPLATHPAFTHPVTSDFALVACHFNPAGYRRPVHNLGAFLDWVHAARLPLFMTELCFHDQHPVLPTGSPRVQQHRLLSDGIMFQKEALLSRLVMSETLPERVTKVFLLDADVVYSEPANFVRAAALLDHARLVQPYTLAVWQDQAGNTWNTKPSTAAQLQAGALKAETALNPQRCHPGFAIGLHREFFAQVGLYGCPITGTGDAALFQAAVPAAEAGRFQLAPSPAPWRRKVARYMDGRIAALPGEATHFWHGTNGARSYQDRFGLLQDFDPDTHLTTDPVTGLPVWTAAAAHLAAAMRDYFLSRREDAL